MSIKLVLGNTNINVKEAFYVKDGILKELHVKTIKDNTIMNILGYEELIIHKLNMEELDYPWNRIFTWELESGKLDHYEIQKNENTWETIGTDTSYTWNDIFKGTNTFRVKAIDVIDIEFIIEWAFTVEVNDLNIEKDTEDFNYILL